MKPSSLARCALGLLVGLAFLSPRALPAATTSTTNTPAARPASAETKEAPLEPDFKTVPRSEFAQPKTKEQGRDPFFPASTHPYEAEKSPVKTLGPAPVVAELFLKGISGTEDRPLAIINTTTFTVGEENDVITKAGRMKIRCLEINMTHGTVVVQLGGERRELRLAPLK
jgi:hypothetical protein